MDRPALTGLALGAFLSLALTGCGGYAPILYEPIPVPDALTKVVPNKNFAAADKASFADASMFYPNRERKPVHRIPVGDYLLSRVVMALPEDAGITRIGLLDYRNICEGRGFFGPHLWCVTNARIQVTAKGIDRILTLSDEADVGAVIIAGDIAPPFNMGDAAQEFIHRQARMSVDHLMPAIRQQFMPGA